MKIKMYTFENFALLVRLCGNKKKEHDIFVVVENKFSKQ